MVNNLIVLRGCNSRNCMVLPSAACSKPISGLMMETRYFGKNVGLQFLGSALMHFAYLLKLSPNLRPRGCHYPVELIPRPGFGRNKVLLSCDVCFGHQCSPDQAPAARMFSFTLDQPGPIQDAHGKW